MRAMFELACVYDTGPLSIAAISKRQRISRNYLEQLFIKLKRRGLVTSVRGPAGGFELAHDPKDVTLWDIIDGVGEKLAPVGCVEKDHGECPREAICPSRAVWVRLSGAIEDVLRGVTLEDLRLNGKGDVPGEAVPMMYCI